MNLLRYFCTFKSALIVFGLAFLVASFTAPGVFADANPVVVENDLQGTSAWRIPNSRAALYHEIEGYASATSVNVLEPIKFYVSVEVEQTIQIEIYRMGFYQGFDGRYITTIYPGNDAQNQPFDEADHTTGLIECDWDETAEWTPPIDTVSGFFLAKLVGLGVEKDSYIIFVVRNDDREYSDFVFQSTVTTYQAYNVYPGNRDGTNPTTLSWYSGKSLYDEAENDYGELVPESAPQYQDHQARMVSFNRPYYVDPDAPDGPITQSAGQFFYWEYWMTRWMEKNGLDVTYITNVDTHTNNANFFDAGKHKAFLTAGHDEYYSWEMRDNLEQARDRETDPMHLGFFSSNDAYWQIRFAPSTANTAPANEPNRTIICYKLHYNDGIYGDPNRVNDSSPTFETTDNYLITRRWRDNAGNRLSGTCPVGLDCFKDPEDELIGAMTDLNFIIWSGTFEFAGSCPLWINDGVKGTPIPLLVGYEPVRAFNPALYNDRTQYLVGDSGPNSSDRAHAVYYKMDTGGRVFTAGSNIWAFRLFEGFSTSEEVSTITMNVIDCYRYGEDDPAFCGE